MVKIVWPYGEKSSPPATCSTYLPYCRSAPTLLCFTAWRHEPLQLGNCIGTLWFPRATTPSFFLFRKWDNRHAGLQVVWGQTEKFQSIFLHIHLDQPLQHWGKTIQEAVAFSQRAETLMGGLFTALEPGWSLLQTLAQQQLHITAHIASYKVSSPARFVLLLPWG